MSAVAAPLLPPHPNTPKGRERFHQLAAEWKDQARYLSNSARMAMLPSYQRIIAMGVPALPLILEELQREPHHWYWALEAITDQDPVPPSMRGDIRAMADAWLEWGRSQGLISS